MKRLSTILALLVISTTAYAQQQTIPAIPSAAESGTRGDMWLMLWISLGFIVVIIGVYMFLKRGGRTGL